MAGGLPKQFAEWTEVTLREISDSSGILILQEGMQEGF
jgi:hypothetical protein